MLELRVNDSVREYQDEIYLEDLIADLELTSSQGIAIAVNQEVIPRTQWKDLLLRNLDNILIIQATQGG